MSPQDGLHPVLQSRTLETNESRWKLARRAMWKIKHKCCTGSAKGGNKTNCLPSKRATVYNVTLHNDTPLSGAAVLCRRICMRNAAWCCAFHWSVKTNLSLKHKHWPPCACGMKAVACSLLMSRITCTRIEGRKKRKVPRQPAAKSTGSSQRSLSPMARYSCP